MLRNASTVWIVIGPRIPAIASHFFDELLVLRDEDLARPLGSIHQVNPVETILQEREVRVSHPNRLGGKDRQPSPRGSGARGNHVGLSGKNRASHCSSEKFTYEIDERVLKRARLMDGKLLLVSNVADSPPAQIVARYKALADIERGFRVLKSEIEIAPVFHRLPDRIRAHALICFSPCCSIGSCVCA